MKIFALLLALTASAHAGALDEITLTDGTLLRGHVTQLKPGDHVELVLLDGRTQSIAWSDMASSVGPTFPPDAPYLSPGPGRVPLAVESSEPAQISVARWPDMIPVCSTTPCTIYVPPGEVSLQASGDSIDPCPLQMNVSAIGGHVTLHPASLRKRSSGVALVIAGIALGIAGSAVAGVGSTLTHEPSIKGGYEDNSMPLEAMGGTFVGVGVGALVSGIVLLSTNHASSEMYDGALRF